MPKITPLGKAAPPIFGRRTKSGDLDSSSGPARTLNVANPEFPRLDAVVPSSFYPGTTTELLLRGANLDDLTAVMVEPPEASVELVGPSGFDYRVRVTVPLEIPTQSAVIVRSPSTMKRPVR